MNNGNPPPTVVRLQEELGGAIIYRGDPFDPRILGSNGINWGTRTSFPEDLNILNRKAPIPPREYYLRWHENGIRCPSYTDGVNLVVRTSTRSGRGRGVHRVNWYTEEIPKRREYRLDFFRTHPGGPIKVFRGFIKYPPENLDDLVWNRQNCRFVGYGYREVRNVLGDDSIELVKNAAEVLKYDFGTMDVIRSQDDDQVYAIDINSAPYLGDVGVRKYASRIRRFFSAGS